MKNNLLTIQQDAAWFRKWFDSSFYHQLYANRDEKEAANFIDELLLHLQPPSNAVMLDLGCGAGRHSHYLAGKGFDVTGLDLAASSIRTANQSKPWNLRFYQHDMRNHFGNEYFDYVFNFFTSFGFFKGPQENLQVISNIARSLKPGGVAVIDYMNAPYASSQLVKTEQKEIDGVSYEITRWEDERYIYKKIRIEGIHEFTEQVEKLSVFDFNCMFLKAGLELKYVFGNYDLDTYERDQSPRLILQVCKTVR